MIDLDRHAAAVSRRRRCLRRWFERSGRDLPWRSTRDPWAVLVAELMLQQTQVERVRQRWPELLDAFPTPSAMAHGDAAAVVRAWSGLGYNRRAVALHRCATALVAEHGGAVPQDRAALEALPGIGPYTSRAVLAFAFEHDVAVLDTNVGRVLARWHGAALRPADAQALADRHVPRGGGWWWNQAMLDLGAVVCVRSAPRCDRCPVRGTCTWGAAGMLGADPADGSAAVSSRQSTFAGSDRQGRGRLVDALRVGPVADGTSLADAMGWPGDLERARRVAAGVVADGLAHRLGATFVLGGAAAAQGS